MKLGDFTSHLNTQLRVEVGQRFVHDKQKGTEYYKTLSAYFDSRFNAVAASKALYIQRSTFLYRMKNIRKLVDIDFESKDEMLYMEMSFKILDIV